MTITNKRMNSAQFVSEYESVLKCPICNSNMNVIELKSLICEKRHTFDFTKQGYINLMTHSIKTKYDKELFEARRKLMSDVGFFEPVVVEIIKVIQNQVQLNSDKLFILDTGCGEGSHLASICDNLNKPAVGVGIDIAKEGIIVASKNYQNQIWAVADLAQSPFKNQQFDVILNILSPSNYSEFTRLLKDDGVVIKIVPQSGYLKELRKAFYEDSEKQTYSNIETVEHFDDNFRLVNTSRITYTVNLDIPTLHSLIKMTPLTWSLTEETIQSFIATEPSEITVDLDILIGMKKTHSES